MLGLSGQNRAAPRPGQPAPGQAFGAARFLLPVQQVEFQLTGILESLSRDPWPVANDKRALRCTGNAVSVAVGLLEVRYEDCQPSVANIWSARLHTPTLVRES
jgi:protein transport protein SEC23